MIFNIVKYGRNLPERIISQAFTSLDSDIYLGDYGLSRRTSCGNGLDAVLVHCPDMITTENTYRAILTKKKTHIRFYSDDGLPYDYIDEVKAHSEKGRCTTVTPRRSLLLQIKVGGPVYRFSIETDKARETIEKKWELVLANMQPNNDHTVTLHYDAITAKPYVLGPECPPDAIRVSQADLPVSGRHIEPRIVRGSMTPALGQLLYELHTVSGIHD